MKRNATDESSSRRLSDGHKHGQEERLVCLFSVSLEFCAETRRCAQEMAVDVPELK